MNSHMLIEWKLAHGSGFNAMNETSLNSATKKILISQHLAFTSLEEIILIIHIVRSEHIVPKARIGCYGFIYKLQSVIDKKIIAVKDDYIFSFCNFYSCISCSICSLVVG